MFTYPMFDDEEINTESKPYAFENAPVYAESINNQKGPDGK